MRVLVTRPHEDAQRTARRLADAGHEAIIAPIIEIVALAVDLPHGPFDAIIATSANALAALKTFPKEWAGASWLIVGERLVAALATRGIGTPEVVAPDVASLLREIDTRYPEPFRFLYLAGADRKPILEETLRAKRHDIEVVETYAARRAADFSPILSDVLRAKNIDAVLHFSRRSADLFVETIAADQRNAVRSLRHVAISADAAAPLMAQGWPVRIAESPEEAAMIRALA